MAGQYRVELAYRLAGVNGLSPTTQSKTWYFEVTVVAWDELLNRIFYDANVGMRRRELRDENWLALDSYQVTPVQVEPMLAWDGEATMEKAAAHLPWILASQAVSWEYSSCYLVDGTGAYDGMSGNDFAELVLYRALEAGRVTQAQAGEFIGKLYPANGASVFADRQERMANLVMVRRPAGLFRRAPGATPYISGPLQIEDLP